jgi:hypothetical protein
MTTVSSASWAIGNESFVQAQRSLDAFNRWRLSPGLPADAIDDPGRGERDHLERELRFLEEERANVARQASRAPTEPRPFLAWFEALERTGPGQHDRLFDFLERDASRSQMTWFLRQEIAGEAGFDDLVALTQVKMPARAKLELARNYWDEMGQGHESGMHGPMLSRLARELHIGRPAPEQVVPEALALGNLLVGLAIHRQYAYHSIGALGVIELTAPGRAQKVNAGLKRLGIDGEARRYFALHATLDVKHSGAWNREVIGPLVEADPRLARPIAEGALMRLSAGARCFERYRDELEVAGAWPADLRSR